jgi:hypothetical protein
MEAEEMEPSSSGPPRHETKQKEVDEICDTEDTTLITTTMNKDKKNNVRDPIGTYIMPLYATASWIGVLYYGDEGKYLLPVSTFGALWALFNCMKNKRVDAGFISMGIVAAASGTKLILGEDSKTIRNIQTVGCLLAAANFALPLLMLPKLKRMFRKTRSAFSTNIFITYLVVMVAFWTYAAYTNYDRNMQE